MSPPLHRTHDLAAFATSDEEDMIWWSPLWALFDEESWQSSYWPWSCQSDRVISLFWKQATRSFLTGSSHQRSLKSELGIVSPAEGLLLLKICQMKLVLRVCVKNIQGWAHFQPLLLKCSHCEVSQLKRVGWKRFRERVENSQICLCWGSHHVTGQRLSRPYRHQVVT